jgi:glyoxylase-like metal-dependent hydrolase (beta-lactamase superfamily II)
MLQTSSHGPITAIRLAKTVFGRPLYTVTVYLVDGLLIDSGPPHTAGEMVAWCREQALRQIVNTHHHEDHSGGNVHLHRQVGLPIYAAPMTAALLADFPRIQLYRRIVWGRPRDLVVRPLGDRLATDHHTFEVIPTPGHSPDHICLWEPDEGWLFSGDLFIHERVRYLRVDEDLGVLIDSLHRALALRPRLLICAHAGLVTDACGALERKIAYWADLQEEALALTAAGLTPRQITHRLLGPEGRMARVSRGHIAQINLIRALLAVGRIDRHARAHQKGIETHD